MANRNMEDMDKLFREGLNPEGDLVTFPEGEWAKLEKRLVRHDQRKRGIFWITRLGGVAALLLLFFSIRIYLPEEKKQVAKQAEVQQKESIQPIGQAEVQPKEQDAKEQPNVSEVASEAQKTIGQSKSSSNRGLGQDRSIDQTPAKERPLVAEVKKETADRISLQIADLSTLDDTAESIVNVPIADSHAPRATLPDSIKSPDQRSITAEEPMMAVAEQPADKPLTARSFRLMALSVLAAPDYNGVDNLSNASLGSDFGLMVSFAFARNWSFSTGGIYAKKLYEAEYENYNPAQNIWTEYYPRSVYADCRVLDIPLNISYTFLKGKNSSISAGSGISSYIMLREDYRFTYVETDSDTPINYRVVNENQHWLSVFNLQVTFEQRLSSRLSVSLQPYMKIPLGAIGFAGVKLQTLGMAANLNWNFN
ncbi:MAG: hypothetical protein H7X84_03090 [Verrucomicrobia bacterium]|nr:hypothetical protein [Prolixibacteraceae bacterium]